MASHQTQRRWLAILGLAFLFSSRLEAQTPTDVLGTPPGIPSKKDEEDRHRYIGGIIDPKFTMDLIEGQARLLKLKQVPRRIQLADESIASYNLITPKEVTLMGRRVGTTVMNFWFGDAGKEIVISYLVRVFPAGSSASPDPRRTNP